jgi:DNA modification methylase
MGGGSTITAACAVSYKSIGIEHDPEFFAMAKQAIPRLAGLVLNGSDSARRVGRNSIYTTGSIFT